MKRKPVQKWSVSGFILSLIAIAACLYEMSTHGVHTAWFIVFAFTLVYDVGWLFYYRPSRWRKK